MRELAAGCTALLVLAAVVARPALAVAPPLVPLQGVLTDVFDQPVQGPVNMRFALYGSQFGGSALWSEQQSVDVEQGHFSVYLGAEQPLDLGLFDGLRDVWVGVKIEDDVEMPRIQLGSVPFAAFAQSCGQVPDHDHDLAELSGAIAGLEALPPSVVAGPQSCTGQQSVVGLSDQGGLVCSGHTHDEYAAVDHTHSEYAAVGHTHTQYAATGHTHDFADLNKSVQVRTTTLSCAADGTQYQTTVSCPAGTILLDCGWGAVGAAYSVTDFTIFAPAQPGERTSANVGRASDGSATCTMTITTTVPAYCQVDYQLRAFCL